MDFPISPLDLLGNRMLIAITAIIHVLINHPPAVGAYPLITLLEWRGLRKGEPAWDKLAYRIVFIVFIITTTAGALTGVGIWLTTSLVAPFAIGSMLRVFFWGWFTEWLVFISAVGLNMAYYLTWKRFATPRLKRLHVAIGATLSAFSWITWRSSASRRPTRGVSRPTRGRGTISGCSCMRFRPAWDRVWACWR